jgi:hypothetical protein
MKIVHKLVLVSILAAMPLPATAVRAADTTMNHEIVTARSLAHATLSTPVLAIEFSDISLLHNMGIASDGHYFYTCDGGNPSFGQLKTYDLGGHLVRSIACYLDMRAIFYNPADGNLYAKTYERDLYRVDPVTGSATLVLSGIFAYDQSSPALTPDGQTLLEHESGTIRFIDFGTGALVKSLSGFAYGSYPSNEAVGTSGTEIFTWDGSTVSVTDMVGNPLESYLLPNGSYGFSLKFVDGLLFASVDGNGGVGHWYGYIVGGATPTRVLSWGGTKALYR